ncbi:MAG: hypothetical protein KF878_37775 [Planctomycetes bacterium]|nr:hypothetical protein [Planctomycetota bacterium]
MTRLRRLELTGTRWLEGPGLGVVARLPHLERLSLTGAHALRGDALAELAVAPRLRALDLSGCAVDAWGLRPLVRGLVAESLRELRLGCYTVNDEVVGLIADLRELEALRLGGARLGDGAVAAAAALPRLRRLELDAYDATGLGLARLGSATLERLHLATPGAELEALAGVISRCPSLRRLGLACRPVDDGVIAALTGCAALEELELGRIGGSDLRLLAPLPRLRRLTLSGWATARDLEALRFGFGALCELSLDVTCTPSNALEALTALPRLEVLRLLDRELGDTCPCSAFDEPCEARVLTQGAREAALASLARNLPGVHLEIRGRTPR